MTSSPVLIGIVAVSTVLMLLRPRVTAEVWWAGGGAVLLLLLHLMSFRQAGRAVARGTDVYLFLTGMMLLAELAREHKLFDWMSTRAVQRSRGRCSRLFALIYGVGVLATICLSNDATAVVLTPAVLSVVRKAKVEPLPHLFACAMIANAASFVLPISNPANLVVFHSGMPPLGSWLMSFLLPSVLAIAATYVVLRWYFRRELCGHFDSHAEEQPLSPEGKLVLWGLVCVVAVLLTASGLRMDLGLPTCLAALAITAVVSIRARSSPLRLAKAVSWSTLLLVAALFILVAAVEQVGLLRYTQAALTWTTHRSAWLAAALTGLAVGVGNNLVNNLPLGLVAGATLKGAHAGRMITNSILIGVDLGPNLSVTGSLATILWLIALRREDVNVSAWQFLRAGLIAMPAALAASIGGLLLLRSMGVS